MQMRSSFTAAMGEAVCCCIIITAKMMKASWVTGINPFSALDDLDLKDGCDGNDKK